MLKRNLLVIYRLFFTALTLIAITTQLSIHISSGFNVTNFFSYFTNLSNLFASLVFGITAFRLLQNRNAKLVDDLIRGSSVIMMVLVSVVYGLLLREIDLGSLLPWINVVLHYVMPAAVVLDWLYEPPKSKLRPKHIWFWLIFPAIYLLYSLVRGGLLGWYPYPFLNPAKTGSYLSVTIYCLVIFVVFILAGRLLITIGNALRRNIR